MLLAGCYFASVRSCDGCTGTLKNAATHFSVLAKSGLLCTSYWKPTFPGGHSCGWCHGFRDVLWQLVMVVASTQLKPSQCIGPLSKVFRMYSMCAAVSTVRYLISYLKVKSICAPLNELCFCLLVSILSLSAILLTCWSKLCELIIGCPIFIILCTFGCC